MDKAVSLRDWLAATRTVPMSLGNFAGDFFAVVNGYPLLAGLNHYSARMAKERVTKPDRHTVCSLSGGR